MTTRPKRSRRQTLYPHAVSTRRRLLFFFFFYLCSSVPTHRRPSSIRRCFDIMFSLHSGWPRPRLTWYHENTVLDSTYHPLSSTDDDDRADRHRHRGGGHRKQSSAAPGDTVVTTVNRLQLSNLTRWHPIMSQRLRSVTGAARLTCQASNSIANAGGVFGPAVVAGAGNSPPPPATTEHVFIRLNRE